MGRKNIVYDFLAIKDGDLSTPRLEGAISTIAQHDKITYHFEWEGADVDGANFGIEYQMKEKGKWFQLDFGAPVNTDTVDGMHRCIIEVVGFKFTRPFTENVSGAGTVNVHVFATNEGA